MGERTWLQSFLACHCEGLHPWHGPLESISWVGEFCFLMKYPKFVSHYIPMIPFIPYDGHVFSSWNIPMISHDISSEHRFSCPFFMAGRTIPSDGRGLRLPTWFTCPWSNHESDHWSIVWSFGQHWWYNWPLAILIIYVYIYNYIYNYICI